ncbi:MAG: helix-turn-helix transcriptional regulator [Actinophytocola sp.]|uniref:helix-turn-helix domain-containing protein n=1 Tax=Actinophytocola sp. TaxID=1872138 RepID=UPI003C71E4A5
MATISWRARSLKAALRSALEDSGMSRREVATQLNVSHTKVIRWMSDDWPAPSEADTASVLVCINVTGDERDRVLSIARAADADWMVSGPPGINPQLASVLEVERYAVRIFEWGPLVWPGLLQSSDYARAVIARSGDLTDIEAEARVMMRIARRDALTRAKPVELTAVVGLPAVQGKIGGATVMADQLSHVGTVIGLDNITIQVLDLSGDWTPGHPGAFILYEFADMPPAVYLEHYRSGAFLVDEADVAAYQGAAETLRREAMSPPATARLIADAIPNSSLETTG